MNTKFTKFILTGMLLISFANAEVTPEQFKGLFEAYAKTDAGKELIGKSVQEYFMEQQKKEQEKANQAEKQSMEDQFKNPIKVDIAGSPVKGKDTAKVTIVEFSDFECPFCSRGKKSMDDVLKAYPNDVKVVFKNLPLPFHKNAKPAALAALAAGKQGKFWEMHDKLFDNQKELSDAFYEKTAKELGLNVDTFKKDLADKALSDKIEADSKEAEKAGISGTPGFLVNGVLVSGAYPLEHFQKIIDRWLSPNPTAPAAK